MSVYEAVAANVAWWATLRVNAPSKEAAEALFKDALLSDEWERVAEEEYQMAVQADIKCDEGDYVYELCRFEEVDEDDDDEYAAVTFINGGGNG